jgi:outer membrane lipase/esterase
MTRSQPTTSSPSPRSGAGAAPRSFKARGWAGMLAVSFAVVTLVAACGGGTSQFEPFIADRVFAFGDENSTLAADGRKYGVNGIKADGSLDCTLEPLWVQSVAADYGYVFAECNPATTGKTNAFMLATVGATVADVAAQVERRATSGGFNDKDLALVMAGANDVLALYAQFPARSENELMNEARGRGEAMARVVNRLVELRAKVVVSTLPDMGTSPYALAQEAANPGRAALITRLTTAFNEQLGVKVLLDGRFVGLMQTDLRSQQIARSAASFGLANANAAVCKVAAPNCTTATLVEGASSFGYFWADDRRLASGAQAQLAGLARERAQRNPF